MKTSKILILAAALLSASAAASVKAEAAVLDLGGCSRIFTNTDCNRVSNKALALTSQRKDEDRLQNFASNYGWAEIQALRAFERMR
jgi:hypothetical protein